MAANILKNKFKSISKTIFITCPPFSDTKLKFDCFNNSIKNFNVHIKIEPTLISFRRPSPKDTQKCFGLTISLAEGEGVEPSCHF